MLLSLIQLDHRRKLGCKAAVCHDFLLLCEEEVQKRNEVIRVLTKHVGMVETREKEAHRELSEARQQLRELEKKQQHIHEKCQDFEVKHQHTAGYT